MSQRLNLRDGEAEALAAELEHAENPDLVSIREKLTRQPGAAQIPDQLDLYDYPRPRLTRMVRSGLEPSLTVYDRRVLLAVPECGDPEKRLREGGPSRTVWEIAEALNTIELAGLAQVLRGLERFGYVTMSSARHRGGRTVWWRTQRGDDAL